VSLPPGHSIILGKVEPEGNDEWVNAWIAASCIHFSKMQASRTHLYEKLPALLDSTLAIQESTLCRPGKSGQALSGTY
jgi:hypothetical protein